MINEKQILALVKLEIPENLSQDPIILNETKNYVVKSIKLLPSVYRIPIIIILKLLNIIIIILKARKFENLDEKLQLKIWDNISKYPIFSSLKRFVRVLALIRSFDFYSN
jgi:hypothetical protein